MIPGRLALLAALAALLASASADVLAQKAQSRVPAPRGPLTMEEQATVKLFESSAPHNASGSLPILELDEEGLRLDRQGIIAPADLERAVGLPIDASAPLPAHFPPMQVPAGLLDDLSPAAATRTLMGMLYPEAE